MGSSNEGSHSGNEVNVDGTILTVSKKIDSGKEGVVYEIKNIDDHVLKIFYEEKRSEKNKKISAMIANDPNQSAIIWPQAVVKDSNSDAFLGYKMEYQDLNTAKNAFEYTMTQLDWDSTEKSHRYKVAENLAIMVDAIHDEGHAIGDFNHDNILIDDNGEVTLIDCDGFHITNGNDTFPDDTYYPRYAPPEGRGGNRLSSVREADRFCLGVHIFQILMEGFHPYHAKGDKAKDGNMEDKLKNNKFPYVDYEGYYPIDSAPSVDEYETELTEKIQSLFKRCFTESGKHKAAEDIATETNRPDPGEWREALSDAVDTGASDNSTPGPIVVRPDSGSSGGSSSTNDELEAVTPDSVDGDTQDDTSVTAVAPDSSNPNSPTQKDDDDEINPVLPEENSNSDTGMSSSDDEKNENS